MPLASNHGSPLSKLAHCAMAIFAWGCGDRVLDLGHDDPLEPQYATPEILNADTGGPIVIASHQWGARALAIDETRVYWVTTQPTPTAFTYFVRSCAKANCAGTLITYLASDSAVPGELAVNESHVFWTGFGPSVGYGIASCPIAGCGGAPTNVTSTLTDVTSTSLVAGSAIRPTARMSWAVDDDYVYWLATDATILKCPVSGCSAAPTLVTRLEVTQAAFLTTDQRNLYWGTKAWDKSGVISTMPKDGSSGPRVIASNVGETISLAVDATHVYWSESIQPIGGLVKSCPLAGCTEPTVLVSQNGVPTELNVVGDRAFWFSLIGPSATPPPPADLVESPLSGDGAQRTVLATEPGSASALAVDATHIYWTDYGATPPADPTHFPIPDGAVKRLRRRH